MIVVKKGDLVISGINVAKGALAVYEGDEDVVATIHYSSYSFDKEKIDINFLKWFLKSPAFVDALEEQTGRGIKTEIKAKKFLSLKIPIPTLNEQKKIESNLNKFEEKYNKVSEELEIQSELINKLRSSILSDAVSGKLVPQDPNDESAEVLLEKIKAEKEKLIKEGKIKKQKPLLPISEDEIPYKLPDGWVWCRLRDVSKYITDGEHQTPPRISFGKKLLSAKNVRDGFLDYDNCDYISEEHYEKARNRCLPEIGDLLIVSVGGTIGRTSLILENSDFALVRSVALIKPLFISSEYLRVVLNSKLLQDMINLTKRGGAQPCLYLTSINQFLFPLPSLEEQKRIVEKVEKLMATCDALELEVQKSKRQTEKLMQSVLKEAFSNSDTSKSEKKERKASKAFQRSVLAAYLVDNSLEDKYFGHVKLQKMLFMCEAVNSLDFDSNYKRHAMGPYDPKLIRSVDSQLKRSKWFECKKMDGDKGRYVYSPLEKQDEYKKYLDRYFNLENIEKMFALMKPMTTLQAEIVATLYSVYKDLKPTQQNISSQMLIEEARNNWHDRKKTIEVKKWERAIEWMREKQLIS
ncbi:restriction endonuclease subunit S [Malaciobacter halophilus]|nr:restriction endonuclease subunit S [Malaciobacter halophilus]